MHIKILAHKRHLIIFFLSLITISQIISSPLALPPILTTVNIFWAHIMYQKKKWLNDI